MNIFQRCVQFNQQIKVTAFKLTAVEQLIRQIEYKNNIEEKIGLRKK